MSFSYTMVRFYSKSKKTQRRLYKRVSRRVKAKGGKMDSRYKLFRF